MCNVSCGAAGTTTGITGRVYDPAGKNPLYNVAVYVPAGDLQPIPKGVPTGADACSCGALFKSGALAATATAVDGSFTLTNVPVGNVALVLQVGKWRRALTVTTQACKTTSLPDGSLTLPGTLVGAGPDDDMPDIAVSTGNADTLECLMTRIGVPASEFVAGGANGGHVHVFSGGNDGPTPGGAGLPERNVMPGAPPSYRALWANQSQLMPFDITLLSCEGGETFNANPVALEYYLNAGGRVFASHFHYAFFSGALDTLGQNNYQAPPAWGNNLSNWMSDNASGGAGSQGVIGGIVNTTLSGSTTTFAKGQALARWLEIVGALGTDGVPATDLAIYKARFNSLVVPADKPSQPWITSDPVAIPDSGSGEHTLYFSFDTPVGADKLCGRAVFSDLHVAGNPMTNDTCNYDGWIGRASQPPPDGCDATALSRRRKRRSSSCSSICRPA
jgi:hypothetical protein